MVLRLFAVGVLSLAVSIAIEARGSTATVARIDHVADGDTITLRNGSAFGSSRSTRP
jgi:hypothetical protein